MRVTVLGAGGATGRECVNRLLEKGHDVTACVRDPAAHETRLREAAGSAAERLQVVAGDVTDPASLAAAINGAAGIIFAASGRGYWSAKAVDDEGVGNVAAAAKAAGGSVRRVVLVSSMLVHPSNRFHPVRVLLNNIRYSLMDHKFAGEEKLRASGLPFCIVRPGGLTNGPAGNATISAQVDATRESVAGAISRADVAAVCVEALTNPAAENKTLSITSKPGLDSGSLDAELARVFAALA